MLALDASRNHVRTHLSRPCANSIAHQCASVCQKPWLGMQAQRHAESVRRAQDLCRRAAHQRAVRELAPRRCGQSDPRREIQVICDILSSHKKPLMQAFLLENRRLHMHAPPTYSSWLNQVATWCARVQRAGITCGVFSSIQDLDQKVGRDIRQCTQTPSP